MIQPRYRSLWISFSSLFWLLLVFAQPAWTAGLKPTTIVVSAEGLSDPNYYRDKTMAFDEALRDAKRQAVEKAVGCYVSSHTIVENYTLISDKVLSRAEGLIKRVIKVINGGVQPDGFFHVWIKAEVYARPLRENVQQMSRDERVALIRERGNPMVSVGFVIRSPDTEGDEIECKVCNTEIRDRLKQFGYKVISEGEATEVREDRMKMMLTQGFTTEVANLFVRKPSDLSVTGIIKLKRSPEVEISGVKLQHTLLTAWALDVIDNHTSEVVYAKNFRPQRGKAFNDEDEAIMEVGQDIGAIFTENLFADFVMRPTHSIMLTFLGIQDRVLAKELKRELLGIRSVLNVTFRQFLAGGETVFEVEFAGSATDLGDILEGVVFANLNRKYGENTFKVQEEHGDVIRVFVDLDKTRRPFAEIIKIGVPAQLVGNVSAERVKEVVKSEELKKKVAAVNKDVSQALTDL